LNGYGLMPFPCLCFPCTVCDNKERITIVQVTLLVANLNLVAKALLRYLQVESSVSLSHIVTLTTNSQVRISNIRASNSPIPNTSICSQDGK